MSKSTPSSQQEYALIVVESGERQQAFARALMMILNYRYGLDIIVTSSLVEAFSMVQEHRRQIRVSFVIQSKGIDNKTSILGLTNEESTPLFLVLPQVHIKAQEELFARAGEIFFCSWEEASRPLTGMHETVAPVLESHGVGELFVEHLPYSEMQQRIERRLKSMSTLPTLPQVAMQVMRLVDDPETMVEDLEDILVTDPAIVYRLLGVINSPIFVGSGHKGGWSLQEAIARLGRRKVGAIAQQIQMMNTLVKPEESLFDLRRFWEHSVGCAIIADALYSRKLISLRSKIEFNDYWIAGLLHDCGKLALGFFFWDHFEAILERMGGSDASFRETEKQLGELANHEHLGRLLLMSSNVGEELVTAVGTHHTTGDKPSDLVCLLHLANNICKDLGMAYLEGERSSYSDSVLGKLKLDTEQLGEIRQIIRDTVADEIRLVVDRCSGT